MTQTKIAFAMLTLLTLGATPAFAEGASTGQMSADKVACAAQSSGNAVTPQGTATVGATGTDAKAGTAK